MSDDTRRECTRRDFLRLGLLGAAAVSVAGLLSACGNKTAETPVAAKPPTPPAGGAKTPAVTPGYDASATSAPSAVAKMAQDPANMTAAEMVHVPQFDLPAKIAKGAAITVTVNVGKKPHVMQPDHWIQWVELYVDDKLVKRVDLKPGDKPQATFQITPTGAHTLKAHENCNKHGLWENTTSITAT